MEFQRGKGYPGDLVWRSRNAIQRVKLSRASRHRRVTSFTSLVRARTCECNCTVLQPGGNSVAYAHGLKRGGGIIPRFSPTFWDVRDELIRSLENSVVGGVRESFIASERLAASRPPAVASSTTTGAANVGGTSAESRFACFFSVKKVNTLSARCDIILSR